MNCSISVDQILNAQLNDSKWCYTSNSNDCELPSGQATPLTLAKDVACSEAACGGGHAINIEYCICTMASQRVTHQEPLCWQHLYFAGSWQLT